MKSKTIIVDNSGALTCQWCGAVFGQQLWSEGKTVLQIMYGLELYRLHGWHTCEDGMKLQVHWDSSDVVRGRIEKAVKLPDEIR